MIELPLYQVDAFTSTLFRGNPAAVVPLEHWLDDATLQAVAAENNLAETAFFVPSGARFELRWFTPTVEVRLCGHATLATAHVLFTELGSAGESLVFDTLSGALTVARSARGYSLEFPRWRLEPVAAPEALRRGLGTPGSETFIVDTHDNYFVVLDSEAEVAALAPDFAALAELHPAGVIVTARGDDADCVCRYFAPSHGVPEDSATGSVHCALAPFWAERLGRAEILSRQLSARGAQLHCVAREDTTVISGPCVTYLEGRIRVKR